MREREIEEVLDYNKDILVRNLYLNIEYLKYNKIFNELK
jgi:hypothetical protein